MMKINTVYTLSVMLLLLFLGTQVRGQYPTTPVYINELHYDDVGADLDESIEVAGPAGTDLSDYLLYLYNGQGGLTYSPGNPFYLSGIIPDFGNGYGTVCFLVPGIQNGSPDGMALVYFPAGALYPEVEQFISYEGFFPANNGPALGDTSMDIGVWENTTGQEGYSLQLGGIGFTYEDFLLTGGWQGPSPATCGSANNNQTFQEIDYCTDFIDFWMTEQTGPAIIDTNTQTVQIEVVTGTDLSSLIPYFDLCWFATVTDTASGNQVHSGDGPMDFSNPVVWFINNKEPGKYWTITVTEQIPEIVINEMDIEQPGADVSEFIELKNTGQQNVNIEGMQIRLIDGATSTAYATYTFPANTLLAGDYFVVCANAANTMNCDMDVSPDADMIQNGSPDAVALYTATGGLVDVVSYGGNTAGYSEGGGTALTDAAAEYQVGLSRFPDGTDTDDNAADIDLLCISPGYANSFDTVPCICTITDVYLDNMTPCDSLTSTFGAYITVEYAKAPGSGTLVVNGNNFTLTGSPQTVFLPSIPATGGDVAVNIYFSENPACAWSSSSLFTSPPACGKCLVTNAWTGTQTSCVAADNFYTQELYIDVNYNPGGMWVAHIGDVEDTVPFIPQYDSVGLLQLSGLISDGSPVSGYVYNLIMPGCVYNLDGLWTAPQNCYDSPWIIINEVDYDQGAVDTAEFIELRNNEAFPVSLKDYSVELINGGSGLPYDIIELPDVTLLPGDYFVLCANPGATPNCDLDLSAHLNLASNPFSIDDGAPDAIALKDLFGTMVDAVSYEGDVAAYVETSGVGVEDDGSIEGNGISRYHDGTDTDNNSTDFMLKCITPGEANTYLSMYCGPFHTLELDLKYKNQYATPMQGVILNVQNAKGAIGIYTSDGTGHVTIDSIGNLTYDIMLDAGIYPWGWGGVNSIDALDMLRHDVGIKYLYGDFRNAGDVVLGPGVDATDALRTAQRFAGIFDNFLHGDWYPHMVTLSFDEDNSTTFNRTIDMLCYGDVNGSHVPMAPTKASSILLGTYPVNEEVALDNTIDIRIGSDAVLGAVSLVMKLPDDMNIVDIKMADGSEPIYSVDDNTLILAWFSTQGMDLAANDVLATLITNVNEGENTGFEILPGSELGSLDGEVLHGLKLLVPSVTQEKIEFSIWPNPAKEQASIAFHCKETVDVSINVMNILGEHVLSLPQGIMNAGTHKVTLDLNTLVEGTYILSLTRGGMEKSKKLVLVR